MSVNAHYRQVRPNETLNIIDAVYVCAVDRLGYCRNITVSAEDCSVFVDDDRISSKFSKMGVSIHPHNDRVRIVVPNCGQPDLVMRVICETRSFRSSQSDSSGEKIVSDAEVVTFVISRGLNLQETSHGLLG